MKDRLSKSQEKRIRAKEYNRKRQERKDNPPAPRKIDKRARAKAQLVMAMAAGMCS